MKKGWQKTTLGEAFTTVTGNTPPKSNPELFGNYIPLVKPPELLDSPADSAEDGLSEAGSKVARIAPPNSILVSCIGNLGKVGLNTVPVAFNQQINAISPDETRAVPEFMFYQVLSCDFKDQLEALSSGTTVPIVNKSRFNSIEVVLPPLAEQQRIVGLLDAAFAGLATAQAHAEKNHQNARALFESHLQSVFIQRGKGWVEKSLGETCEMYQPKTIGTKDLVPDGPYPVFGANGIIGRYDKFNHEEPQLLVTCRGATCGSVNVSEPKSWITGNAMVVRPLDHSLDLKFLEFVFRGGIDISKAITGAAQPQITRTNLSPLLIRFPKSVAEQEKLAEQLENLAEETQRLATLYERKQAALAALKQSLLHQAFTGAL